jgi:hypothetical protein
MRSRKHLFVVTAAAEVGIGLGLLAVPGLVFGILLGVAAPSPEALLVGRVGGAALLAIGVTCWLGRGDPGSPTQKALLYGVLLYDVAASALLVYAWSMQMSGFLLWPAVAFHAVMSVWCGLSIWK